MLLKFQQQFPALSDLLYGPPDSVRRGPPTLGGSAMGDSERG